LLRIVKRAPCTVLDVNRMYAYAHTVTAIRA
jgi:hypothetical protein